MKKPIVVIGIGEIGSVFARGFMRLGYPVYPVTRDMDMQQAAIDFPEPELVLVAVGEGDLDTILEQIPEPWRDRVGLIQNELLPVDWKKHDLANPTVISVWFEKKKGQDSKVVVPSPVYGPQVTLLHDALASLDIPATKVDNEAMMLQELVRKNYYILTSNIAGLRTGGSVSELWRDHQDFARDVTVDIHALQEHLVGESLDHDALIAAMVVAFEGDPDHQCMGRSAPVRLQRALAIANAANIDVPTLQAISDEL
ncbi:MAG: Unknown protein [uncultured Thiotrichaceae bacterium]|uniref:Ketopantoate reductase n=1 Tax=uncultured Thiotrichaceae bacterium TaxID=298394 RepID=A0A6S6SVP8_9GAMM|nr:MAG: Unknown protein [uncultured Thiotrichaceae bacterium]